MGGPGNPPDTAIQRSLDELCQTYNSLVHGDQVPPGVQERLHRPGGVMLVRVTAPGHRAQTQPGDGIGPHTRSYSGSPTTRPAVNRAAEKRAEPLSSGLAY
jgi:hypothetical protein